MRVSVAGHCLCRSSSVWIETRGSVGLLVSEERREMSSEGNLRTQYQYVLKERDELQAQCDTLTRENLYLRKAVYELTNQLSSASFSSFSSRLCTQCQSSHKFMLNSNTQQFGFYQTLPVIAQVAPPPSTVAPAVGIENHIQSDNRLINFECELKGHNGPVYCVDITPDNRFIASGSFDKTIIIWRGTVPYKQEAVLTGHTQLISAVCWGREPFNLQTDKKNDNSAPVLYSTSFDKTVRIWDTSKGSCLMVIKLKGYGTSLTSCPRNMLYTRGCALVTTATSYFYLIAHPNPGDPNEYDISASLTASERMERQNLLSPVQLTPSSPTASTPMRSRSNSDSYVVGGPIGNSISSVPPAPLPAVYFKHASNGVPSAMVCLPDGLTLFVGDTSGAVTWYELKNKDYPENYPIGTYVPNVKGKYLIEDGRSNIRILYMQYAGGPKKESATGRSNDNTSAKSAMSSKFISRISPSTTTTHSRTPQPTLLALQCSDNTIRLYQVDLIPKISSQSLPNDAKTLNEFLIPLRLLRDHTTGGQWPIRLSFRQGPLFHITTPQPAIKDNPVSVISDSSQAKPNIPLHPSNFHPTQKQIMRVRATDASGLVTSVSSGSLAATSGDEVSSTTLQRPPKPPSHVLSDDVSVNSDVSEILLQSSSTKTTRQKHLEDDGQETESLLSGKGAISADEGRDDDAGSVGSENGAADDSGDDEARLNMIAGLATSTLLTANHFESGLGSLQQSSKNSKNDDLDLLLGGSLRRKVNISQNYQRPIDWTSSFVLATGSNNGQIFLYDLSSISEPLIANTEENDLDTSAILSSWKVLDGHQSTGKAYGAIFSTSSNLSSSTSSSSSSLITFSSDGTLQIWSVLDET